MGPRLIRVRRYGDERGWFSEIYSAELLASAGLRDTFVQDNHSFSARRGTLRGLHFQAPPHAQAKLVRCTAGAIWDVAVDLRHGSPTRGRWVAAELSAEGGEQIYVPAGFGHGFVTLTDNAEVQYKVTSGYAPDSDGSVRWDDPEIAIAWPIGDLEPILSKKDANASPLALLTAEFPYDGEPLGELVEVAL